MRKPYEEMTPNELRQEKAKIELLLRDPSKLPDIDNDTILLHSCIDSCIFYHLRSHIPPLEVLYNKKPLYTEFLFMLNMINSWAKESLKQELSRPKRLMIYSLVCDLLANFILNSGVALSLTSIVHYQNMFPGVFEAAFPGYIKSDMVKYILNAKIRTYDDEDLI